MIVSVVLIYCALRFGCHGALFGLLLTFIPDVIAWITLGEIFSK